MSEAPVQVAKDQRKTALPPGLVPARRTDPHTIVGNQATLSWLQTFGQNGLDYFYASRAPMPIIRPVTYQIPSADHIPEGYHYVPGIVICVESGPSGPGFDAHHWLEMYGESYGWYPRDPTNRSDADQGSAQTFGVIAVGVTGELNAQHWNPPGTPTRDRAHGKPAVRYSVIAPAGQDYKDIAPKIRAFAAGFKDLYSWNPGGTDCMEFLAQLMEHVGIFRYQEIPPGTPPV